MSAGSRDSKCGPGFQDIITKVKAGVFGQCIVYMYFHPGLIDMSGGP